MNTTFVGKSTTWLLRFLELQLFITLISLPILIIWGIPISLLTLVGNLIFAPIFTCFLCLSSIIFFCQLLHIPSTPFITMLTLLTNWWTSFLNIGSHKALVGYALQSTPVLLALPLCALLFLQHKSLSQTKLNRVVGYTLLLLFFYCYVTFFGTQKQYVANLKHNKNHVTIINDNGHIAIIDYGALGRSRSSDSWSEYTLLPTLIKKTGCTKIDTLILTKPGKIMFDVVEKLCTKVPIKTIYLITWEGTLPKHYWRSFFRLKKTIQKNGITFYRIGKFPLTLTTSQNQCIQVSPGKKILSSKPFLYPQLNINRTIDNTVVPFV